MGFGLKKFLSQGAGVAAYAVTMKRGCSYAESLGVPKNLVSIYSNSPEAVVAARKVLNGRDSSFAHLEIHQQYGLAIKALHDEAIKEHVETKQKVSEGNTLETSSLDEIQLERSIVGLIQAQLKQLNKEGVPLIIDDIVFTYLLLFANRMSSMPVDFEGIRDILLKALPTEDYRQATLRSFEGARSDANFEETVRDLMPIVDDEFSTDEVIFMMVYSKSFQHSSNLAYAV